MRTPKLLKNVDLELLNRFRAFHKKNPQVYSMFKSNADFLITKGVHKTSAWLIFNKMRWDFALRTKGERFKVNNDYIGLYSRMFVSDYPKYKGLFNFHCMKRVR